MDRFLGNKAKRIVDESAVPRTCLRAAPDQTLVIDILDQTRADRDNLNEGNRIWDDRERLPENIARLQMLQDRLASVIVRPYDHDFSFEDNADPGTLAAVCRDDLVCRIMLLTAVKAGHHFLKVFFCDILKNTGRQIHSKPPKNFIKMLYMQQIFCGRMNIMETNSKTIKYMG